MIKTLSEPETDGGDELLGVPNHWTAGVPRMHLHSAPGRRHRDTDEAGMWTFAKQGLETDSRSPKSSDRLSAQSAEIYFLGAGIGRPLRVRKSLKSYENDETSQIRVQKFEILKSTENHFGDGLRRKLDIFLWF